MNLLRLIDYLRDRLPSVIRICLALLALLVVFDALPLIVDKEHAHTAAEHVPGFWSLFGLLGCLALVVVSKTLGHAALSTREDYYDE
jgi:short subunit fatty acids transporter